MGRKKWEEKDEESRFKRELSIVEKRLSEAFKALNDLGQLVKPMEYKRAWRILWTSMAVNARHSLIRALIMFHDEYVELREGSSPSLDDVDRLIDRWFGKPGFEAWTAESALPIFENYVKKVARIDSDSDPDSAQTEIKTKEKKNDKG